MANFYTLPNGTFADLAGAAIALDVYNNVQITLASGKVINIPNTTTQAAINQIANIAAALGVSYLFNVLWSTDNATWVSQPITVASGFYLQINGVLAGTPDNCLGPSFLGYPQAGFAASSSTQWTTEEFSAINIPAGTYTFVVINSSNNTLATFPLTFTA